MDIGDDRISDEHKALVVRALLAAASVVPFVGAGGTELAFDAVGKARAAVERSEAPCPGKARRAPALAMAAREAFAAWAGPARSETPTNPAFPLPPATGRRSELDARMAVLAVVSSAVSYTRGDHAEAKRLAGNVLRFATVASGGSVDWTKVEG